MYYLYIIKDVEERLYIGITNNPKRRLHEHNNEQGSGFTKSSSPFSMVFLEEYPNILSARKREIQLKKWSRVKKEKLIEMYNKNIKTKL